MADLVVITPTRGRPERFAELVEAVHRTTAGEAKIWAGLDDDDESDYWSAIRDQAAPVFAYRGERRSLSAWTSRWDTRGFTGRTSPGAMPAHRWRAK